MKKLIKEIIYNILSYMPFSNRYSMIKVTNNGFWKTRAFPRKSLCKAANIFNKIGGKTIIEVGTGIQGPMSGNSVLIWAKKTSADHIIVLDLDKKQIESVLKKVKKYKNIKAITADGIKFLGDYEGKIDLLYLDFWTPDPPDTLIGTGRENAYLKAYEACKNKLNNNSLILIDDTDHIAPWKHTKIIPSAREDGFRVIYTGRQTLLQRKSSV